MSNTNQNQTREGILPEWINYIKTVDVDFRRKEIQIESWPVGDLRHMWSINLRRTDEPTVDDVLRLARDRRLYRVLWLSLYVEKPPFDIFLSVDSHEAISNIQRAYLMVTDLMPRFRSLMTEGSYVASYDHYYALLALLTLPGDRISITLESKQPFRGNLTLL